MSLWKCGLVENLDSALVSQLFPLLASESEFTTRGIDRPAHLAGLKYPWTQIMKGELILSFEQRRPDATGFNDDRRSIHS